MKQNKTERQARIDALRSSHMHTSDNDWFFDKFEGDAKKVGKNVVKVWLGLAVANILIWGVIIFMIALALKWVF